MSKTIDELYGAILDAKGAALDAKNAALEVKTEFVRLEEHVNDELELMNKRIESKADVDDMLRHLAKSLVNHRVIKWGATGITTGLLALVVQQNLGGPILHIAEWLAHMAQSL